MSGNVCPVVASEGFDPPVVESGTMLRTIMDHIMFDAYQVMGVGSLRYGKTEMAEMIARCIDRDIEAATIGLLHAKDESGCRGIDKHPGPATS